MKLGDELRGQFSMECQWSNNGFSTDELSGSDDLRVR